MNGPPKICACSHGDALPEIVFHRREVADFARRIGGDRIGFASFSYLDLWREWSACGVAWLEARATQLARRYRVEV